MRDGRASPSSPIRLVADGELAFPWAFRTVALIGMIAAAALLVGTWMIDLQVYRAGGSALIHSRDLYTAHPAGSALVFTYPPFAAVVFTVVAVLPNLGAEVLMTAASAAGLLIVAHVGLRAYAPTWTSEARWTAALTLAAVAPLLQPIRETLWFGQINIVLMALIVLDICGLRRRRGRGCLVGFAAAIKLTPAVFILYLFATRRTREGLTAAATALSLTAAAFVVAPTTSWRYWTHLMVDDTRVGDAGFVWNQSLRGAIARAVGSVDGATLWWIAVAAIVFVVGLHFAVRISHTDEFFGLGIAALTALLVSPISWDHHWVWSLPIGMALWRRWTTLGGRGRLAITGAWAATFCLVALWWWDRPGPRDYRAGGANGVIADGYVLLGIVVLASAALESSFAKCSPAYFSRNGATGRRI